MKFFIAILSLTLFITVHGLTGCAKETGADINLVKRAKYGDFEFEDQKTKNFFFCMYDKMGFIKNHKILMDYIMTLTTDENREIVTKAFKVCGGTTGETDADLCWNFAKCYSKQYPEDIYVEE